VLTISCNIFFWDFNSVGDGRKGYPDGGPYDAIHVGAAAATIPDAVSTFMMSDKVFVL